jgi:hypothetical protein
MCLVAAVAIAAALNSSLKPEEHSGVGDGVTLKSTPSLSRTHRSSNRKDFKQGAATLNVSRKEHADVRPTSAGRSSAGHKKEDSWSSRL